LNFEVHGEQNPVKRHRLDFRASNRHSAQLIGLAGLKRISDRWTIDPSYMSTVSPGSKPERSPG
jgi:hypothetical protein